MVSVVLFYHGVHTVGCAAPAVAVKDQVTGGQGQFRPADSAEVVGAEEKAYTLPMFPSLLYVCELHRISLLQLLKKCRNWKDHISQYNCCLALGYRFVLAKDDVS